MNRTQLDKSNGFNAEFVWGCAFWIAFSFVAMLIRGIRWDEDYEFAQAMIGAVPYDDAHPLRQYTLAAYNFQFYSSALILKINDDPVFLCGFRSLLFNLATVLPVFMLGAWISLRTWIGHLAVVFILIGVHLEFDGVYPQFIWPGMFSNGHVGMGYVLIFAGTLAAGHLRCAGLLLGLMPAVHLGQMPPAAILATCYAIRCIVQADFEPLKSAVRWFCMGLVFCGLFYFAQQQSVLPPVTQGPYYSESDVDSVWQGRINSGRDMHRSFPTGNIHLITVATLLISLGGWRFLRRSESPLETAWFWLTLYAFGVIGIVYTVMLFHHFILNPISLGVVLLPSLIALAAPCVRWRLLKRQNSLDAQLWLRLTGLVAVLIGGMYGVVAICALANGDIPYLLLGWLPYRLMNHLAPILLIMCVTFVGEAAAAPSTRPSVVPYLLPALLLFQLAKPLYPPIFGESIYFRYLFHNDSLFFVLVGAAMGILVYRSAGVRGARVLSAALAIVSAILLVSVHQFGAVCVAAGLVLAFAILKSAFTLPRTGPRIAAYLLGTLVLVALMKDEYSNRRHLPIGAFEAEVARVLDEDGKPDALVAARPDQVLFQAQTGHPVVTDMATEFHASYRPSLGPSVQKLYEDVYGIWFEQRGTPPPSWQSVWNARTPDEWSALHALYNIEYLVAPNDVHPQATLILKGELDSLYRIP